MSLNLQSSSCTGKLGLVVMHLVGVFVVVDVAVGVPIFSEQENILRIAVFLIVCFCLVNIRIDRDEICIAPRLAIDVGTFRRRLIFVSIIQIRNTSNW